MIPSAAPSFKFFETPLHFIVLSTQLQHMTAGTRTQLVLDRTTGQVFGSEHFNPIKEGNISPEALKFLEIFAFLGTIRLGTVTLWVVVTEATTVAVIGQNKIMSIKTVELRPVNPYWQPDASDLVTQSNLQKVGNRQFFTTGFYFSDSIDITNSLQRIQGHKGNLHTTADPQFYWNRDMYSDLVRAGISPKWFIPAIQGFVSSTNEFYSTNQVQIILISRRSCLRAGTSEAECGLDDDGNVANFIETEQIVRLAGTWFSFVQVRGTVPVFWQLGGDTATRSLDSTSPAFKRHFDSLISSYKHVMVINLLSTTKSDEVALNAQFNELLHRHQQALEQSVCYFPFDYKVQCKGDKHANIRALMSQIAEMLTYYGYFSMLHGQVQSIQKGVPRVNCADCLDRTNLTMARIAWEVFSRQFQFSGLALELDYDNTLLTHPLLKSIRSMWADNGDMLSRIYIGVGSSSTHMTRTGKNGLKAFFQNKVKTVERLLKPTGERRQDTTELILGNSSQRRGPESGGLRDAESTQKLSLAVHICTWNLAGNRPPENENLSDWLIDPEHPFPKLVVVGLQEMVPLNTKHVLGGSDQVLIDTWKQLILSTLNYQNRANYCWVQSQEMVGCLLSLFAMEHMLPHITGVDRDVVKVGFGNMAGNKGSVLLRFNIKDTSLCFWNCHLESGMDQIDARFNQLTDICTRGFAGRRKVQPVANHDVKVLLGDLNFRISLKNAEVRDLIDHCDLVRLKQFDQLLANKRLCPVLASYMEGDITFLPTYKYDKNSAEYDTSKKMRVPAWCDRILCAGEDLVLTSYRRSESRYSDHRPVSATIMVAVKRIVADKMPESEVPERHRNSMKASSGLPTASIRPPSQQISTEIDLLSLDDTILTYNIKTQQRNSEPPSLI